MRLELWKERQLEERFIRDIKRYRNFLKKQPLDIWYYFKLLYLSHEEYLSVSTDTTEVSFSPNLDHLENFFIAARLNYLLVEINRKNIYNETPRNYLSVNIIPKEKLTALSDDSFIVAYLEIIELLADKKEKTFFQLKDRLAIYVSKLSKKDQMVVLMAMFNFASIKLRAGQEKYQKEKISLYQFGLESGILLVDNYLDGTQFLNIINLACVSNDLALAIKLKEKWLSTVLPKEQENTKKITDALIYFYEGSYESVLKVLRNVKFFNTFYTFRSRSLIVLSLFMTQPESPAVLDYCTAFDLWLRREKKLSSTIIKGGKNAMQLIKLYYQKRNVLGFDWSRHINSLSPLSYALWFKNQFLQKVKDGFKP